MATPNDNKITTVPRNWKTMFGNKNDNDINNMFLTIEAWSPPTVNAITTDLTKIYDYTASEFLEGFKFFYPRDNIQEQIKHTYSDSSSSFSEAMAGFRGGLTKNLTAVVQASTGTTGGALTEEPHIYTNSERRTFSINIPLIAYDDLEKDIYEITKFFRKNSYPRRSKDSKLKALLNTIQYPSVFKIRGGLFDTNQPVNGSTFVVEDCTIDYNPNVKAFIEGLPIEVMITIGFTELNLLFGEDFDATPVKVNVSYSGGKNNVAQIGQNQQTFIDKTTKKSKLDAGHVTKSTPLVDEGHDFDVERILDTSSMQQPNPSANPSVLPTKLDKNSRAVAVAPNEDLLGQVKTLVKESKLAKRITNLPETIEDVLRQEATDMVKSSDLYKKVTALTDNDPIHLLEVKAILKKIRG